MQSGKLRSQVTIQQATLVQDATGDPVKAWGDPYQSGIAQAGSANTLTMDSLALAIQQYYRGWTLALNDGSGRSRVISDFVGATKVATVPTWAATNLSLPGTAGNAASTPDSLALGIVGDIDIRAKLSMSNWASGVGWFPLNKMPSAADRSWRLGISTTGFLTYEWSVDGTGATLSQKVSSVVLPVAAGGTLWVRATHDVDNGAAGNTVAFYTSSDGGVTWTPLGTTFVSAGITSIFNSVGVLGINPPGVPAAVYYAEIRNGIGGGVIAAFDPLDALLGATSITSSRTGEVWTLSQSGSPNANLAGAPDATTPYTASLHLTPYARIEPVSGREFFSGGQFNNEIRAVLKMRYVAGITPSMRALYGGRIYNIEAVLNPDERDREMQLLCSEGLNDG